MGTTRQSGAIMGSGVYLPDQIVSNDHLEQGLALEPGFIEAKTGIRERRLSTDREDAPMMAAAAAVAAARDAGVVSIDQIIVARDIYITQLSRSVGLAVIEALGSAGIDARTCSVMDVVNYCLGFTNALNVAKLMVESGDAATVLIVASADYTDLITAEPAFHETFRDSGTYPSNVARYSLPARAYYQAPRYNMCLWGCGAGAVVVGSSAGHGIGRYETRASDHVRHDVFGFADRGDGTTFASLDGRSIATFALTEVPEFLLAYLAGKGVGREDIDLVIPHQANALLLRQLAKVLSIPLEKLVVTCDVLGNLGCASIPVAYHTARTDGRIEPDQRVLLCPFGDTQLTMGAVLLHT